MPTELLTKTDQEKMVPIDTSGESVDVEVKEDKKENNEDNVINVEEEKDSSEQTVSEEEQYSQTVKKRIDKMTFKIREAERQREEALKYAESVKRERDELKTKVTKVDEGYLDEYKKRVNSELDKAKQLLGDAITKGDVKAQVEAQKAIARLAIEEERANSSTQQREKIKENLEKQSKVQPQTPQTPQPAPQPDPKAEAWAEKNEWFGKNEGMTYTALSIHKRLINEEGFDGKSDAYYKELDKQVRKEFPHKFEDKNKDNRVVQTVVSANRSTKSGRRTVRLTPSQVAIAKKLGVPLEEYAKEVISLNVKEA